MLSIETVKKKKKRSKQEENTNLWYSIIQK